MDALGAIGWEVIDRFFKSKNFSGISPHGIGIAVGYLAGSWWLLREGKKRGLREDDISTVLLRALVGAIVGARFFYVMAHFGEFDSYVDMLKIWQGGISLIGGIFGAIIFAYPYMRKAKMGFLRTMDSAAIGLAFGIIFGRVGDLIIGDHLGKPTSWLLGFVYKGGNLSGYDCLTVTGVCREILSNGQYQIVSASGAELHASNGALLQQGIGIHQTALYDFISTFFLFALLLFLARRPRHRGVLIAVFALWYGVIRVVTDFLRVDKRFWPGLTGSQWASLIVALIAGVALLKWSREGAVQPAMAGPPTDGPAEPPVGPPEFGPERMTDEGGPPPEEPADAPAPQPQVEPSAKEIPEPLAEPESSTGAAEPEPAPAGAAAEPEPPPPARADATPRPGGVTEFTPPPDPTAT
jgi:phosphatidylglycerol:prolipoprotein diacylglycerol transferase